MPGNRTARSLGATEWALLVALSVLWGGTFFFAEVALAEVRPLTLVFARVSIAAGALVLAMYASGQRMPRSMALWSAFLTGADDATVLPFKQRDDGAKAG